MMHDYINTILKLKNSRQVKIRSTMHLARVFPKLKVIHMPVVSPPTLLYSAILYLTGTEE